MIEFPLAAALVVPHSSRMLLIDTVIDSTETSLTARAVVRGDNPFLHNGAIGAWIGVEYMAQAIAAFEGCRARLRGVGPKVGFLIGSRHFTCTAPVFAVGEQLEIRIDRQWEEGPLGLFEAKLTGPNGGAEATLSVFQPDDAGAFLAGNQS